MSGCGCGKVLVASGDTKSKVKAKVKASKSHTKAKAPKEFGSGKFCVFSTTGKKVRCFTSEKSAQNVARGFGTGFTVRKPS